MAKKRISKRGFFRFWFCGWQIIFPGIVAFVFWGYYWVERDPIGATIYLGFMIFAGIVVHWIVEGQVDLLDEAEDVDVDEDYWKDDENISE